MFGYIFCKFYKYALNIFLNKYLIKRNYKGIQNNSHLNNFIEIDLKMNLLIIKNLKK